MWQQQFPGKPGVYWAMMRDKDGNVPMGAEPLIIEVAPCTGFIRGTDFWVHIPGNEKGCWPDDVALWFGPLDVPALP